MKAEHRKELQTNILADHLGKIIETVKGGPNQATILGLAGVLAVILVFFVWRYVSQTNIVSRSAMWVALDGQTDPDKLKEIAKESRGELPARVARLKEARALFQRGMQSLCFSPTKAQELLDSASEIFAKLAEECRDEPLWAQEALNGVAKVEEARGDLDKASATYKKLADAYPQSTLGIAAKERIKTLTDKRQEVVAFYDDLKKRTEVKPEIKPPTDPMPGLDGKTSKPGAEIKLPEVKPLADVKAPTAPKVEEKKSPMESIKRPVIESAVPKAENSKPPAPPKVPDTKSPSKTK